MFQRNPLLLAALSYLAGLIFASKFIPDPDILTAVTSTAVLASITIFYLRYNVSYHIKDKVNESIIIIVFVCSFFLLAQLNLNFSGYHYKITKISSIPPGKTKYKLLIIDEFIRSDDKSTYLYANCLIYNEKVRLIIKEVRNDISVGDTIIGTIYFYPIKNDSINSGVKNYMALKQIYTNGYTYPKQYCLIKNKVSFNQKWISNIKHRFSNRIKKRVSSKENASVILALTTGYKGDMEKGTIMAFSKSGSMHLMAVSGLHVNYIHLFLAYILYLFGNTKWLKFGKTCLALACIWFFTLFAGMTASILRASIMISCSEVSKLSGRCNKGLNSLSFAFLLICILNPESFFDAGFRLSFLATLSIIIIHTKFVKLCNLEGKIIKYIWNSVSISISCQLGTLPLTIAYFGYIPVYFMICNLAAVPISALIILFTSIITALPDGLLCDCTVIILDNLCRLLLWVVKTVESLPYATINFI